MVKKKGRAYREELKRHKALEAVVKNCPNLEVRKEVLAQMDLWRRGAIEGEVEALIKLSEDCGLYDDPPDKNE